MADQDPLSPEVEEIEPADAETLFRLKEGLRPAEDYIIPKPEPQTVGLPKILGHQLTLREWAAFEAYIEETTIPRAARKCGVEVHTLRRWQKETWWAELFNIFVAERQQDLHTGLLALTENAIDATRRILTGELEADAKGIGEARYATAIGQAVQLLTKIGKNPLQDNRSITNIDNRSLINTGTVHISREKLETLDQDEMLKMITGQVKIE